MSILIRWRAIKLLPCVEAIWSNTASTYFAISKAPFAGIRTRDPDQDQENWRCRPLGYGGVSKTSYETLISFGWFYYQYPFKPLVLHFLVLYYPIGKSRNIIILKNIMTIFDNQYSLIDARWHIGMISILVYPFFTEGIVFLLYLDEVTNAYWKKRGLVILDRYFGKWMETNGAGEKVKKRGKTKFRSKTVCTHIFSVCSFAHLQSCFLKSVL